MNIEEFQSYCLSKKGVTEEFPFGPETLVYKVMGKIFAITGLNSEDFRVNLKCDPDKVYELREEYPEQILPGYHMNKAHWNTVLFEEGLNDDFLISLIDDSYDLIVQSLKKSVREAYDKL